MNSKLSVHYIPTHGRPADIKYFSDLQPRSIKFVDPDVQRVSDIYKVCPNSLYVFRNWALSEQHDNVLKDPEGTAQEHVESWIKKMAEWKARNLPLPTLENSVFLGINEPHVWNGSDQTVRYNVAFLNGLRNNSMRGGALNLSVGWPANDSEGKPVNWNPYEPIHELLKDKFHFLFLHEYWSTLGPNQNWGWWAGRYTQNHWQDVNIVIGECGFDIYVEKGSGFQGSRGWITNLTPDQYMEQLKFYNEKLMSDDRIHSAEIFTTDYGSRDWATFDTEQLHQKIVEYDRSLVYVPIIENKPNPVEKNTDFNTVLKTTDALNMRDTNSTTGKIIITVPASEVVNATDKDFNGWVYAEYQGNRGYMSKQYLTIPEKFNSDFDRAMAFVFKWEGGYVWDQNDPGGETNFGISKNAHPNEDIKNLTKERAKQIYFNDYWLASGADKLAWSMALSHFDCAVNCGVSRANQILSISNSVLQYNANRLTFYTGIGNFNIYGKAWVNRVADLMKNI